MKDTNTTDRVVEAQIEIAAPVEAVWRALTDADELTRWFPLKARVKPGVGGSIWMSWEEHYEGEAGIRIWEPNRHLRTGYRSDADADPKERPGALELMIDYHLEAKGGGTVLRLVHSGFGREGQWDEEYDGVRRGWAFELRSLRLYLERHRGQDRRVAWAMRSLPDDQDDQHVWARLMSPQGLLAGGDVAGLGEGSRYAIETATGQRLEGTVFINDPPLDFSGTVSNLNDGLVRLGIERGHGGRTAVLWLATYGVSESAVAEMSADFETILGSGK